MNRKLSIALAAAGIIGLALTGCSTEAPASTSDKAVTADKPQETTTPTPEAKTDTDAKFGETVSYEGLDLQVSAGTPFTPSEYASTGSQPNNIAYTVTIKNTGKEKYDPSLIYITASSAGSEASEVFDSEGGFGGAPQTSVAPGATISYKIGYNLANPNDVRMDVNPGMFDYEAATYTN